MTNVKNQCSDNFHSATKKIDATAALEVKSIFVLKIFIVSWKSWLQKLVSFLRENMF